MNRHPSCAKWNRVGVVEALRGALLGALLLSLGSPGASRADDVGPKIADLDWMAGCWEQVDETSIQEECWQAPRGDTMLGVNRTTRTQGRGSFEFLRITTDGEGVVLLASPSGKEPTPFRLTSSEPGMAVFENPDHDFPQRLAYRHEDGVLRVRVEARDGEQTRGFELHLERTTSWP